MKNCGIHFVTNNDGGFIVIIRGWWWWKGYIFIYIYIYKKINYRYITKSIWIIIQSKMGRKNKENRSKKHSLLPIFWQSREIERGWVLLFNVSWDQTLNRLHKPFFGGQEGKSLISTPHPPQRGSNHKYCVIFSRFFFFDIYHTK